MTANLVQVDDKRLDESGSTLQAMVVGDEPSVNVVFLVPGSLGAPEFGYLREGTRS